MKQFPFFSMCVCLFFVCAIFSSQPALCHAQDDLFRFVEEKQKELKMREERVASEEKRLDLLRRDVEVKFAKYTKLLGELDNKLKEIEKLRGERLEYLVKVYEGMPPEEAAAKINSLDDATATEILMGMKSRKASAIMANLEVKKATAITYRIAKFEKKIPSQ